jgi:hypothetical protein
MREKRHWENQIVALGGANYRRNVAMLDDDGKEVPGTKGYKFVHICYSNFARRLMFARSGTSAERKNFLA